MKYNKQKKLRNSVQINKNDSMDEIIKKAAMITPSRRQLLWQEKEFYAFIHFGINTFTNREWGPGNADPAVFNPSDFDAHQWVRVCREAGMNGLILTCKHHDGFCLWPSRYTEYSVKNSPWKDGKGDIVGEVASACRKEGLGFGIYLSPWDRHEKSYGNSPLYNKYFKNQLRELLTNYGQIFCVWFDGACGEGPDGKRQQYDWEGYYKIIRELQPGAVISVCGPDVRWCGNEAGQCRKAEWSVVPGYLQDNEKIAEKSQKEDGEEFRNRVNTCDQDLGSRNKILDAEELIWYPAEVNTSIRPGWFYHREEDNKVRSLEDLLSIYYDSVGGNACFLLNIPPDRRGLIHENDALRLKELGDKLKYTFNNNLALGATAVASETMDGKHNINNIFNDKRDTFWCPEEGTEKAEILIDLKEVKTFDTLMLKEYIKSGQRVESFTIEYKEKGNWKRLYKGSVIGHKKIAAFDNIDARYLRLSINRSRWQPRISFMGLYKS